MTDTEPAGDTVPDGPAAGQTEQAIDDRADPGPSTDPGGYTDRGERAEAEAFRGDGSYSAGEFAGGTLTGDG
jgi:hypothetical protein